MISFKHFNELDKVELYHILQLRAKVFVVEQNCPYLDLDDIDLSCLHIQIRNENNVLIGTGRIITHSDYTIIGRVVSHPEYRKQKIGHRLMQASIDYIVNNGAQKNIKISAQSHLVNFYAQHGFVSTGKEYLEDDIPHTEMIRTYNLGK